MSITGVIIATLVVSITGLIIGVLLGVAGEKFNVEVDERESLVREVLPGYNCGGCGYAGCDALAAAIASGEKTADACTAGGASVAEKVAKVMGVEISETEKQVAFVKCAGTCEKTKNKYNYYGIGDCKKIEYVPGHGEKQCVYGCMGYGSCVRVCPFDAIHIVDGIALVDREKCTACSKCIAECPNNLIELVPYNSTEHVRCNSKDKGKDVKLSCSAGCIACKICEKVCPTEAIKVNDNIAHIDYSLCTNCGECAKKCPVKVIS